MDAAEAKSVIASVFSTQRLGVLATEDRGQPYTSLVAFAATDDLRSLIFATTRNTRKHHNLITTPGVAMLMDNRSTQDTDFRSSVAITALGAACETHGPERQHLVDLFLARHPQLRPFIDAPDSAVVRIDVHTYYVVSNFQEVVEYRPT